MSVVSSLFNPSMPTNIEKVRESIEKPADNDSNYTNMVRYEYVAQLLLNAEIAFRENNKAAACEYVKEADRISEYHGKVKELMIICKE